ncbi:PAS domain-containing protein [Marinigracilibium pacificum]|uniref:PAS domain-containing protein n=1 Tax=Marinigracilibium pacificum TaxID=2729599 RepID=A0A848J190_9BACT|nr:PAS domain-containing protein [Marinigracilibium pacificum]NMM49118.1 PAS domain-containing protein [Marinigracilibium pacificum]
MNPFKFGQDQKYTFEFNRRVYLGNTINIINFFLIGPLNLIASIKYQSLIILPILLIVNSIIGLALAKFRNHSVAKIITIFGSFIPFLLWLINLNAGTESLVSSQISILLAYAVLPFGLYSFEKKTGLIIAIVLTIITIASPFIFNGISFGDNLEQLANDNIVKMGGFFIGSILIFMFLFAMSRSLSLTEENNSNLRAVVEEHNKDLEKSQEELKNQLEEAHTVQLKEKNRAWVIEGLGRINSLIRKHDDPKKLASEVISEIVTYIGANQGSIFLLEEDEETNEKYLELNGTYAFDRKKFVDKKISVGEGLVGQSFLEKEPIILKDIPQNYVTITSGLGGTTPGFLVIYPLINNEVVEGILEIASFDELEDHKMNYLEGLGESLASTFNLSKINYQTKYLLELSKQQEEEMRSQAEELQQNMEELQATQEEIARKAREVEEQNNQLKMQEEVMRQNMEELQASQEEMDKKAQEIEEQNNQLRMQEEMMHQQLEELEAQKEEMELYYKRNESLKQNLESRQRVLALSTILSESDLYGTILFANKKLCEVSKYSEEELVGSPHKIFRHPDMPSKLFKKMWETIQSGETFRGIIKNRAKDGSIYWVDAVISPELDKDGKPEKYIGARYVIEDHEYAQKLFDKQMENF